MKRLTIDTEITHETDWIRDAINNSRTQQDFIQLAENKLCDLDIRYYEEIGKILTLIGFNTSVTREGDVNCRFDATIINESNSIPIEIKSPKEDPQINIKSIRQALENKIVLLSRGFFPTTLETTSLAIAMNYPPSRSDVYELIDDIKSAWGFNIGIINLEDLLEMAYDVIKKSKTVNHSYIIHLKGKLEYEKAIIG